MLCCNIYTHVITELRDVHIYTYFHVREMDDNSLLLSVRASYRNCHSQSGQWLDPENGIRDATIPSSKPLG